VRGHSLVTKNTFGEGTSKVVPINDDLESITRHNLSFKSHNVILMLMDEKPCDLVFNG
jgi:hypothetical protein